MGVDTSLVGTTPSECRYYLFLAPNEASQISPACCFCLKNLNNSPVLIFLVVDFDDWWLDELVRKEGRRITIPPPPSDSGICMDHGTE